MISLNYCNWKWRWDIRANETWLTLLCPIWSSSAQNISYVSRLAVLFRIVLSNQKCNVQFTLLFDFLHSDMNVFWIFLLVLDLRIWEFENSLNSNVRFLQSGYLNSLVNTVAPDYNYLFAIVVSWAKFMSLWVFGQLTTNTYWHIYIWAL